MLTALSCGGGGGGPSGPNTGPVSGRYTGQHKITFTLAQGSFEAPCNGSLDIVSLSGANFQGTLTIQPCQFLGERIEGGTTQITGSLGAGGSLTFVLANQQQFIDAFTAEGCVVQRIDSAFTGTLQGRRIDAVFTANLICDPPIGAVHISWRVDMTRASS